MSMLLIECLVVVVDQVNVTYHAVECGDQLAEPIVFGHGLCENWR